MIRFYRFWIGAALLLALTGFSGEILLQSDGADGWTAIDQAFVAELSRRPGSKSLLLRQLEDAHQDSAWLSPVLKNPGQPVKVSLWAADNYIQLKDHSFSAAFELVPCDADGNLTSNGGQWTYIPWVDERQIPQFNHTYTEAGLQWQYYESVETVRSDFFRVRLTWPKSRMQGECYFDDIQVALADTKPATGPADEAATKTRFELELSTSVVGNLFYADEPFRWEFLLYTNDNAPVGDLVNPELRYEVTDYEYQLVAEGTLPFTGEPLELPRQVQGRNHNLHASILLPDGPARQVGRHFYLRAELLSDGEPIASDIVTYGIVDPLQFTDEQLRESRQISFYEGDTFTNTESPRDDQSLMARTGMNLHHDWDYHGWRKAQPTADAPIQVEPGPAHPKLVYCPNLEQVRGRKPGHPWGDMSHMAPEWAVIDDPLRPGCKTFEIDPYVDYIVAYVRANRERIVQVVPSGLERTIDARTMELHRKAYAALKAEFPDLPVGMMVWGVLSKEGVDMILEEKLYEVADFFDTHVYLSAVDWTEWERLRKVLRRKGIERRLISTEFARVGGSDQLQRSRDVITSQLDAHAHDMYRITYFNMYAGNNNPLDETILRGEYPGDGFAWMQYVDRPRISAFIEGDQWRRGLYGKDYRGSSLMPMLHTMAFYNFVQATECAEFKAVFQPTERSIAYFYERDDRTRVYVYLREPADPAILLLKSELPYTMQDLFGRNHRVEPRDGVSMITATLDPLLLTFDGVVPELYAPDSGKAALSALDATVDFPAVARGAGATLSLSLPSDLTGQLRATVEGPWAGRGEPSTFSKGTAGFPIRIAPDTRPGIYTSTVRLYHGVTLTSVLKLPVEVSELLTVTMQGVPMTANQNPAIAVTVSSLGDQPMSGTIRLRNAFFGEGYEPAEMVQPYEVPPRGTTTVQVPVPRNQVSLATSYVMRATLRDDSGFTVTSEDDISFQASLWTAQPLEIDGDLGDWQLDELVPIPFSHWHRGPRPSDEFDGHFYSRWDESTLYFAAVVTDRVPVLTGGDKVSWNDDNIMFCLYPWRWHMGEPMNTGYYREHLGPLQDGGAGFMRAGYVPSGPATAEGAKIAVTHTDNGWIYEWAYPRESLHPLELTPGGGFRLSLSLWDQHQVEKQGWGKFSWLTFAGHNTSVNAQPDLWHQFTFVKGE